METEVRTDRKTGGWEGGRGKREYKELDLRHKWVGIEMVMLLFLSKVSMS